VRPVDAIYVGDTAEDMEMSARAGVRAIGVLGPFPTAERIRATKPEVLMSSIAELPGYLELGVSEQSKRDRSLRSG
jgi:phosphoglycolate phosphatase-like HAD superfamily hydrolase